MFVRVGLAFSHVGVEVSFPRTEINLAQLITETNV
jgi:hypothetical protein